jgi:hypothetical protein
MRNADIILVRNTEGNGAFGRYACRGKIDVKMDLEEV